MPGKGAGDVLKRFFILGETSYLIWEAIQLFLHVFPRPEGVLLNECDFSALQNNFKTMPSVS